MTTSVQESVCPDLKATGALAAALARHIAPGDILFLIGPLGAGKTTFVRLLAQELGAEARDVVSPTYALLQEIPLSRGLLVHLDLYRLERPEDALGLGLDQLPSDAIVAVEWPERGGRFLGEPSWRIRLTPVEQGRRILIEECAGRSVV